MLVSLQIFLKFCLLLLRMEVIRKFPSESERKKYDLDMDSPVWLPTNGEVLNGAIAKAMKSLSDWLKNGYKD